MRTAINAAIPRRLKKRKKLTAIKATIKVHSRHHMMNRPSGNSAVASKGPSFGVLPVYLQCVMVLSHEGPWQDPTGKDP
jgi:hypothetical protein